MIRPKPTDKNDLFKMYISMIKNISYNDIILSKQKRDNNNKKYVSYELNNKILKNYHIKLNLYSNKYLSNYDESILKKLDVDKPKRPNKLILNTNDPFVDDNNENCKTNINYLDYGLEDDD